MSKKSQATLAELQDSKRKGKKNKNVIRKGAAKKKPEPVFNCTMCTKKFTDKYLLSTHLDTHSTTKPFVCPLCPFSCKTKKYLARHHKNSHSTPTKYECSVCKKMFHFRCKMLTHMRVHTGEKPNKCNECGKAFNSRYSLNSHKLIHKDVKPFECSFCPYACRDSSTLRKHQLRHMGLERAYQCNLCQYTCKMKHYLKTHIAEKHMKLDVRKHKCPQCKKRFRQKGHLSVHIKHVHERKYAVKCELCGLEVANKYNLAIHAGAHVDARPYVCGKDGCEKSYKDPSSLAKHMRTHNPSLQLPCSQCGERFTRRARLVRHARRHGPGLCCHYCGASFVNKLSMAGHIRRLHGDKLCSEKEILSQHGTKCSMCGKRFKERRRLLLHYEKLHGVSYKTWTIEESKPVVIKKEPKDEDYELLLELVKKEPQELPEPKEYPEADKDGAKVRTEEEARKIITSNRKQLKKVPEAVFDDFYIKHIALDRDCKEASNVKTHTDEKRLAYRNKCINKLLVRTRRKRHAAVLERARREYNERMRAACGVRREKIEIKYFNNNKPNKASKEKPSDKNDSVINHSSFNDESLDNASLNNKNDDHTEARNTEDIINDSVESNESLDQEHNDVSNENIEANGNNSINELSKNDNELLNANNVSSKDTDALKDNTEPLNDNNESLNDNNESINDNNESLNDNNDSSGDEHSNYSDENDNGKKSKQNTGRNKKLKFNTHQCYICFKLYPTKEELIQHCKDHFDVCNTKSLKKCPLCDYVTNQGLPRHMKLKHDVTIRIPYAKLKDKLVNTDTSRYYFEIDNPQIPEIEVIPSVRNLNKIAMIKIDRKTRDDKHKMVAKTKLVKKGGEWVVEQETINVKKDEYLLPEFTEDEIKKVKLFKTDDYIETLKRLYEIAKLKKTSMLFPCKHCSKICRTVSALKLHCRKHDKNKKPFKKKVWKHKVKNTVVRNKKITIDNIKRDSNRDAKPKPIKNRHKCDEKLKEFYRNNIRGGDIEFWQFLKIYNKMGRENVKDFSDLESRSDFGIHIRDDVAKSGASEGGSKNVDRTKKVRRIRSVRYKRVIMISRSEYMRRNVIKKVLREKIAQGHV